MESVYMATEEKRKESFSEADIFRIYEGAFPAGAKIVKQLGGSLEDAKDVFHDAMIIFMEKKSDGQQFFISERAYLLGVVKKLSIRRFNQQSKCTSLADVEQIDIPTHFYPSVNDRRLFRFLEKAGKKCLELLHTFYYMALPVKEIAEKFGYANEHTASVQKYKCIHKLRNIVKEKSLEYEDFVE